MTVADPAGSPQARPQLSPQLSPQVSPLISVLMPTFDQAHFSARALAGLQAQTLTAWEAVVVDDGSRDATAAAVAPFLDDARIRYVALPENVGLGRALNVALDATSAPLVAYLPSDDVVYARHLESLAAALAAAPDAVLAYAGVRWRYNREAQGRIPGDGHAGWLAVCGAPPSGVPRYGEGRRALFQSVAGHGRRNRSARGYPQSGTRSGQAARARSA